MKKIVSALAVIAAFIALSGCNTMRGLGEDVQKAGEKLENAAKK